MRASLGAEPLRLERGCGPLLQEIEAAQLGALCSPQGTAALGGTACVSAVAANVQQALAAVGLAIAPIAPQAQAPPSQAPPSQSQAHAERQGSAAKAYSSAELREALARRQAEERQQGMATAPPAGGPRACAELPAAGGVWGGLAPAAPFGQYPPHAPQAMGAPPQGTFAQNYWQPAPRHSLPSAAAVPAPGAQPPQPAFVSADSPAQALPKPFRPLRVNDKVRLQGLAKQPTYNGMLGQIRELRQDGRYVVCVMLSGGSIQEVAVKPECLTLA